MCFMCVCVRITLNSIRRYALYQTSWWFTIKTRSSLNCYLHTIMGKGNARQWILQAVFINIQLTRCILCSYGLGKNIRIHMPAWTETQKIHHHGPYVHTPLHVFNLIHQRSSASIWSHLYFFIRFSFSIWSHLLLFYLHIKLCVCVQKWENFIWMIAFVHTDIY